MTHSAQASFEQIGDDGRQSPRLEFLLMLPARPPMTEKIRREIFYTGRVQGVGFRWTAHSIAGRHEVTGYVCNLDDGRVHLVAEGEPEELDRFLGELAERMKDKIRQTTVNSGPATGEFAGFDVAS